MNRCAAMPRNDSYLQNDIYAGGLVRIAKRVWVLAGLFFVRGILEQGGDRSSRSVKTRSQREVKDFNRINSRFLSVAGGKMKALYIETLGDRAGCCRAILLPFLP